jgi:hypothetical protein
MSLTDSIAAEQRRQIIASLSNEAIRDAKAALDAGDEDAAIAIVRERGALIDRYTNGGYRHVSDDSDD